MLTVHGVWCIHAPDGVFLGAASKPAASSGAVFCGSYPEIRSSAASEPIEFEVSSLVSFVRLGGLMKAGKDGRFPLGLLGEMGRSAGLLDSNQPRVNRASPDLDGLADQLSAIARELRRVPVALDNAADLGTARHQSLDGYLEASDDPDASPSTVPEKDHPILAEPIRAEKANAARTIYAQRRRRNAIFGISDLFGEPAWDILLDLYIAEAEHKPVSVSSACIGSAAPPTTGLRWLGVLAENDLILREHDPEDKRRVLVRLTQRGISAMNRYFSDS